MTDCYRILGVSRHAAPGEIRAAYLARMKQCHPDAGRGAGGDDAGEISQAYWQLRDAHRRAEHDRLLFGPPPPASRSHGKRPRARVSLRKTQSRPAAPKAKPVGSRSSRRRPRNRRLQPLRAAAGVAACALAIAGFTVAGTQFGSQGAPQAQAAVSKGRLDRPGPPMRRAIDPGLAAAASNEFRQIVARGGLASARLYARQCLLELTARPTMTMLDYCLAFDDEASVWERNTRRSARVAQRHFAADQRYGRYASAARTMSASRVRDAILTDVAYFAAVED